jgi:hypothetical protein
MAAPLITGPHESDITSWSDPAESCIEIFGDKSDTVDLPGGYTRGLISDAGGVFAMIFVRDSVAVTRTLVAGTVYPYRIKRLMSTNTSGTQIAALR